MDDPDPAYRAVIAPRLPPLRYRRVYAHERGRRGDAIRRRRQHAHARPELALDGLLPRPLAVARLRHVGPRAPRLARAHRPHRFPGARGLAGLRAGMAPRPRTLGPRLRARSRASSVGLRV